MDNINQIKILIVEDDKTIRDRLFKILSKYFVNIFTASNGQEVIKKYFIDNLNSLKFDLILSDMNMPHMNGLDMLKSIRTKNIEVPIIFLTAKDDKASILNAIDLGISNYMIKPINLNSLIENIKIIYEKKRLREKITKPVNYLIDEINRKKNITLVLAQINNFNLINEFYTEDLKNKYEFEFNDYLYSKISKYYSIKFLYTLGNGKYGFILYQDNPYQVDYLLKSIYNDILTDPIKLNDLNYEIDIIFSYACSKNTYQDALIGLNDLVENKQKIICSNNLFEKKQINIKNKFKIVNLIKDALNYSQNVISLYQPIFNNVSENIEKYESLIRIKNNKNEMISPYYFLNVAKETGYYHDLTLRVIENISKVLKDTNIRVTINLSFSDIERLDVRTLLLDLISVVDNHNRITFELLEDEEITSFTVVKNFITLSKILGGVEIAIDDFGSGYSNYQRILDLEPNYIKIDGSLIKNIEQPFSKSVIKSIVLFSKENDIKTIAEFVENEFIFNEVKKLDIDYSQGYYIGKPEPI